MKTRNIILGMLLFAFSACTPENKSVTEPLTPEETEEIDKSIQDFLIIMRLTSTLKWTNCRKARLFTLNWRSLPMPTLWILYKTVTIAWIEMGKQAEEKAIQEWNKKFDIENSLTA